MPFTFTPDADLPDVVIVDPDRFTDDRGWFEERFASSDYDDAGLPTSFVQDNLSWSRRRGTLRGLHYQLNPYAQGKLVSCPKGAIYDVAVDLRRGSPTYGEWTGVEVTRMNGRAVWVPPGFAHGILTLDDDTYVYYKCTEEYVPDADRAIVYDDPSLGIDWPQGEYGYFVSEKDASAPTLQDAENNYDYED